MALVVLAAGGTGGHIFPAVSLSNELKDIGISSILLTDFKFHNYYSARTDIKYRVLPIKSYVGKFKNKIIFIISLIKSIYISLKYMIKAKYVVGFGGYPSLPVLIAAILLRKKIIIHEQNAVLGLVNRIFSRFAYKIALGFEKVLYTEKLLEKCIYTGNPVTKNILKLYEKEYKIQPSSKINILIVGGSQGSSIFAKIIPYAIKNLPKEIQKDLFIMHQVPKSYIKEVKKIYDDLNCKYEVKSFFSDIETYLSSAHIAISRSGALSITELAIAGIPAIYIPMKYSAHDHQIINAKTLSDLNASFMIKENDLSIAGLSDKLIELIEDFSLLEEMSKSQKRFALKHINCSLIKLIS